MIYTRRNRGLDLRPKKVAGHSAYLAFGCRYFDSAARCSRRGCATRVRLWVGHPLNNKSVLRSDAWVLHLSQYLI